MSCEWFVKAKVRLTKKALIVRHVVVVQVIITVPLMTTPATAGDGRHFSLSVLPKLQEWGSRVVQDIFHPRSTVEWKMRTNATSTLRIPNRAKVPPFTPFVFSV